MSPMGRSVYNTLFNPPRVDISGMFLPGRTAFVYDLEDAETNSIPTTLRRSKADCPPVRVSFSYRMAQYIICATKDV